MPVDGAGDTEATLARVAVRANRGRGVWAQGLTGSLQAPRLRLTDAVVEQNRLVGVGARGSGGLVLTGGRIADTRVGPAMTSTPGQLVDVGDGLGLFAGTGAVRLEQLALSNNERTPSAVSVGTGLGVVLQNSAEAVVAPSPTVRPPGQELPFSAPSLGLPAR